MNRVLRSTPPGWFWAAALLLLAWNGLGVFAYLSSVTASDGQQAALPFWITGAFAIAVFAGLAGAIGLLIKRGWARSMFALSLVAALVQQAGTLFAVGFADLGISDIAMILAIDLIAVFAIWLSARGIGRGWLR